MNESMNQHVVSLGRFFFHNMESLQTGAYCNRYCESFLQDAEAVLISAGKA